MPTTCSTDYGTFTFTHRASGVLARYPSDNGRIVGRVSGGRIDGYWVEKASAQRCKTQRDGSFYWGRFVATMTGTGFSGKWSYCEAAPDRNWNGRGCR